MVGGEGDQLRRQRRGRRGLCLLRSAVQQLLNFGVSARVTSAHGIIGKVCLLRSLGCQHVEQGSGSAVYREPGSRDREDDPVRWPAHGSQARQEGCVPRFGGRQDPALHSAIRPAVAEWASAERRLCSPVPGPAAGRNWPTGQRRPRPSSAVSTVPPLMQEDLTHPSDTFSPHPIGRDPHTKVSVSIALFSGSFRDMCGRLDSGESVTIPAEPASWGTSSNRRSSTGIG